MYKGIAGSEGIGIGDVVLVKSQEIAYEESSELSTEEEKKRFEEAVDKFVEDTTRMAEDMRERIGEKESEILMGHTLMIQDPSIADEITDLPPKRRPPRFSICSPGYSRRPTTN